MLSHRLHRGFIGLFIGLFLCFQIASTAHAARYDDVPHEHDGVACLLGAVTVEDHVLAPVILTNDYKAAPVSPVYVACFISADYTTPPGRAPPPRSPPSVIL
jgi:hypothetical protein